MLKRQLRRLESTSIKNSSIHWTVRIWNSRLVNIYDSRVGEGTRVASFVEIGNAKIGRFCKIQAFAFIPPGTVIEDYVEIAPHVCIGNDKYPDLEKRNWKVNPVTIKYGAIVGAGAVLVPGITIGRRAVVGAGSVVTKDIPSSECWKGNPAKFYMTREEYDKKRRLHETSKS